MVKWDFMYITQFMCGTAHVKVDTCMHVFIESLATSVRELTSCLWMLDNGMLVNILNVHLMHSSWAHANSCEKICLQACMWCINKYSWVNCVVPHVIHMNRDFSWDTNLLFYISVVPINRITIRNSRLLRNFVTIGIGKF